MIECPEVGIKVPADPKANAVFRRELLARADDDEGLRRSLMSACRLSCRFWMSTFAWTFHQKRVDAKTHRDVAVAGAMAKAPLVMWPIQAKLVDAVNRSIEHGGDVCVDKSRDMGATWTILGVYHWHWLFTENATFLELSRKEELVDKRGAIKSLFEKHRLINKMLPWWMLPKWTDNHMLMINEENGSQITGESTNEYAGQADRCNSIMLDEFARMDNGHAILTATADTSPSRIFNSTPNGAGTAHYHVRFQSKADVIVLGWWDHPEKGRGAVRRPDEQGKLKWWSPWYQHQCDTRPSKREIAENLDINHLGAGEIFFDPDVLAQHETAEPMDRGDIAFTGNAGDEWKLTACKRDAVEWRSEYGRRAWSLWTQLDRLGRPPQDTDYVIAADIANGSGASNSVISVWSVNERRKVATYADPHTSPEALAQIFVQAGLFFGGRRGYAFAIWEANGPGVIFGSQVVHRWEYPWIFKRRDLERRGQPRGERYGWHSSRSTIEALLGNYRVALARGDVSNPDKESLRECGVYQFNQAGVVIHGDRNDLSTGAREQHGDRVIADALGVYGLREVSRFRVPDPPAPEGSYEQRKRMRGRRSQPWDFTMYEGVGQ